MMRWWDGGWEEKWDDDEMDDGEWDGGWDERWDDMMVDFFYKWDKTEMISSIYHLIISHFY